MGVNWGAWVTVEWRRGEGTAYWWAGEEESDVCAETKGLDNGRELINSQLVTISCYETTGELTKFLNPLAARCICCMKTNSQTLGSTSASFNPFKVDTLP